MSRASLMLRCLSAVFAGVAGFFLWLAAERSALPYDGEGNYFDGTVSYHAQSVTAFVALGALSLVAAAVAWALAVSGGRSSR